MRVEVMGIKKILEALTKEKAPGPSPSFQVFHIIKTLELVAVSSVGRGMLAKKLNIGEGATRTLIERLKNAQIISTSKAGCTLTMKGKEVWKQIKRVFSSKIRLEKSELTLSTCNVAILAKGKANGVKQGMEQRDAAFLAGAKGATTLVMRKGRLAMPGDVVDIGKKAPNTYARITGSLKPHEGDVVIIGSADTCDKAEYGAIAAAWTLIDDDD
jgi:Mn-dependent DtxR family transcriptional regulator